MVWFAAAALVAGICIWVVTLSPIADVLPLQLQGWRTVGSYFDKPPAFPGKRWTNDGRSVPSAELVASGGPTHCGWDSITMMYVGWPLGTRSASAAQARQYIRDPGRALQTQSFLGSWAKNPQLPACLLYTSDAADE